MKILICDDDVSFSSGLKNTLSDILTEFPETMVEYEVHNDPSEVFEAPPEFDLCFTDISMPGHTGVELTKKLTEKNPHAIIFFVTSFNCYVNDALDLRIFRYFTKPLDKAAFARSVRDAVNRTINGKFTAPLKGDEKAVMYKSDIIYITIEGRYTKLYTKNGGFESDIKIDRWPSVLRSPEFYQIHKSFIVNLDHITEYHRDRVIVSNGDLLPVSYRKQTEFKKIMFESLKK